MSKGINKSQKGSDVMAVEQRDMAQVQVKVVPRSSKNQIVGKENGLFRIKLTAPPIDGRANKALKELLAKRLHVPKKNIQIISGQRSQIKSVRVQGISPREVGRLLEKDT